VALLGGAATKSGIQYEDWWTLLRVADVLTGRATRIRLEPPGASGAGIEFWVDEPGTRWCEQVKNEQSTWTVHRLITESVLTSVAEHLAAGHQVRLVTASPAPLPLELSSRARTAESLAEYLDILTAEQEPRFTDLVEAWNVPQADAWRYLQRIHIAHQPEELLRRLVQDKYEGLVEGDPEAVVNELRGWLDDQLHKTLTAPTLWAHLDQNYRRRLLAGDPTTLGALDATVRRHARGVTRTLPASVRVKIFEAGCSGIH
jgi:hypothetical protein